MKNFSPKCLRLFCLLPVLFFSACDKPGEIALEKLERENFQFTAQDFVRAATLGDETNIENFITAGIDLNAKNPEGYTALLAAAERGHERTLNLLLNAGANIDLQGKDGWSALMLASFSNHLEIVRKLVDAGADTDLRDNNGWTALMQAVYQGHDKVVEILAPSTKEGLDRALLVAALMGHDKVIEILINAGADINAPTEDGETALMLAAQKGRIETVRLLLDKGALKSPKNNIGETAEVIANTKGYSEIGILIAEATLAHPDPQPTPEAPVAVTTASPEATDPALSTPDAPVTTEAGSTEVAATTGTPTVVEQTLPLPEAPAPRSTEAPETAWFEKYSLDLNDPVMLDADPDGDGFSNRDEYLADTNPLDATSRPALAVRLRLTDTSDERLPIMLESVDGSTAVLRNTSTDQTHRLTRGDAVPGLPYTLQRVRARANTDKTSEGKVVDISEVEIRNTSTGKDLTLIRGLTSRGGGGNAHLYLEGQGNTITARQGESFTLPNDSDRQYEVVDIRPDQVVVREKTSGQVFTVNPAN